MDAVAAAIMELEDDPAFNARRGAAFTYKGINELDASIIDHCIRKLPADSLVYR
jgi:L-asparaginase / beta-aspartyl-peptidase